MKTKYLSPLFGSILIALGLAMTIESRAIPTSQSDELYSDSLYIERASAEIPGSFESSARESQLAQETFMEAGADHALESMNHIEAVQAPTKKRSKN